MDVSVFFESFFEDVSKVGSLDDNRFSEVERNKRIESIACRIFGLLFVAGSAILALSGFVILIASPLTSLIFAIAAVAFAVFAHEAFVVGNNAHETAELYSPLKGGNSFADVAIEVIKKGSSIVRTGYEAGSAVMKGESIRFKGTWLLNPAYKIINKIFNKN